MGNYWLDLDKREDECAQFHGESYSRTNQKMMGIGKIGEPSPIQKAINETRWMSKTTYKEKEIKLVDKKTKVVPLTLDQSVLWDEELVNRTDNVNFVIQQSSGGFCAEGLELVTSPNTWIDAPDFSKGMNLRWKTPIRLRYKPKAFGIGKDQLAQWLYGPTNNIRELGAIHGWITSSVILYLEKDEELDEVWTLQDAFPKNTNWEIGCATVEFSIGYSNLKQRVVREGIGELLA